MPAKSDLEAAKLKADAMAADPLLDMASAQYNEAAMEKTLPADVYGRFKEALVSGAATSEADQEVISKALFAWSRELGATDYAHWFFPMRGGSGAVGGMLGGLKCDAFIDLDWSSSASIKPYKAMFPDGRLYTGETDGSSFPNGGLRATHTAAAFTSWDRSSPCFVYDKVLRIPCAFVTHDGKCIDEKTPLLRSQDAVAREGLKMLKAVGCEPKATTLYSYLGWEQEFFVVSAELYKKRPDLVNCGRTLFGKLPPRNQNGDLNYFGATPPSVEDLLVAVQAICLKLGMPMSVRHNEVAPGQHEMSPIFCASNASADGNVLFMEICTKEAYKRGLVVLFHEKPFAGINGNGKHANWSVGTDSGLNFFYPGKTPDAMKMFTTGVACLAYGLAQHNELVRCSVAHAGNDHRLGAQEAPPAIISLYPGTGFEQHVDALIAGTAELDTYKAEKKLAAPGCASAAPVETNVEDRNRTAPFPFCGNRFEFRACGSSQNCAFPILACNAVMAAGFSALTKLVEGGKSHKEAVAQLFKDNRHVIFTGNGYSAEWPVEAKKRGLPNLNTTPLAIPEFASAKNKQLFKDLQIYAEDETDARAEVMYENYNTTLCTEVETMVAMVKTAFLPACAKDLALYAAAPSLAGDKAATYGAIKTKCADLEGLFAKKPHDLAAEATYLCDTIKPAMDALRAAVDAAESEMSAEIYPFPTYEALVYSHHF